MNTHTHTLIVFILYVKVFIRISYRLWSSYSIQMNAKLRSFLNSEGRVCTSEGLIKSGPLTSRAIHPELRAKRMNLQGALEEGAGQESPALTLYYQSLLSR